MIFFVLMYKSCCRVPRILLHMKPKMRQIWRFLICVCCIDVKKGIKNEMIFSNKEKTSIFHQDTQIRKRQICLTLGFIWSKIRGNSAATFIKQKNHKIDWILRFWGICLCKWRFTQNSLHKKTVWHSKFLEKMNLHKETQKDGKIQSILRLFCFTKLTAKFPV